jgi:phospholipid-binding lipoprotein MlaA
MSIPLLATAMLLGGAPEGPVAVSPPAAILVTTPVAPVQSASVLALSASGAEPPVRERSATQPESTTSADQSDIVVTARAHTPGDPLAATNAKSFAFTQRVDAGFVGPVALAYQHTLPGPLRSGVRNVLKNLHEPVVFVNYMLQLKPGKAAETVGRFAINSTVGVGGLFDVARKRPFSLPRRPNGFADTLGFYGVKPGPFMYLPLIGPTTLRDLAGGLVDRLVLPLSVGKPFNQLSYTIPTGVVATLDHRAEFDEQLHKLHDGVADPYANSRDFYLQRRQAEIDALHGKHPSKSRPPTQSDRR